METVEVIYSKRPIWWQARKAVFIVPRETPTWTVVVCEDMETHQSIRSKQARSDAFAMPGGINQSRSRNSLQGYMISQVDVVTFTVLSESYRFYDSFGLAAGLQCRCEPRTRSTRLIVPQWWRASHILVEIQDPTRKMDLVEMNDTVDAA